MFHHKKLQVSKIISNIHLLRKQIFKYQNVTFISAPFQTFAQSSFFNMHLGTYVYILVLKLKRNFSVTDVHVYVTDVHVHVNSLMYMYMSLMYMYMYTPIH